MIKLSKIEYRQFAVIGQAISNYVDELKLMTNAFEVSNETKMFQSVATELLKEVDKKLNKDFPSKEFTLKMPYHKVIVLLNALKTYMKDLKEDSYELALMRRYFSELQPKINTI